MRTPKSDFGNNLTRRDVGLVVTLHVKDTEFLVGRVQRMVKPGASRGRIECRRPICLDDDSSFNIQCHLVTYKLIDGEFVFCPGDVVIVSAKDIIMSVTINICDNDRFKMDPCDMNDLNELMKLKKTEKSKSKAKKRKTDTSAKETNCSDLVIVDSKQVKLG